MFAHPLGLLALFAVPAVVVLHLFRRRFQPRAVSALFLWDTQDARVLSGRRREPLERTPSFWCEVLAALFLALALAGPRACGAGSVRHLVVVLDASASMTAIGPDGLTARERGVRAVRQRIDDLAANGRVTLVVSGERPRVLAGPAALRSDALDRLTDYRPDAWRHDLGPAIALAEGLAGSGEVWVVSDEMDAEGVPERDGIIAVGVPCANVGIARATRAFDTGPTSGADSQQLFVTVTNFSDEPAQRVALALEGERELLRESLNLGPRESVHLSRDIPGSTGPLEVQLTGDSFPLDDRAFLAPPFRRVLRVHSELPPALAAQLGLSSHDAPPGELDRLARWLPDCEFGATDPHLIFSQQPVAGASGWNVVVHSEEREPRAFAGPFLLENRHPLLDGLTLEGVIWGTTAAQLPGFPLISAGDLPLYAIEESDRGPRLHLGLNPGVSSVTRSPDWPILLANLAEARRAELGGPSRTNLILGEALSYRRQTASGDGSEREAGPTLGARLSGPGQDRTVAAAPDGRLEFDLEGDPGFYRLSYPGDQPCLLGISFADSAESDLTSLSTGTRAGVTGGKGALRSGAGPIAILLAAGALVLVLLDWWVVRSAGRRFHRSGPAGSGRLPGRALGHSGRSG